MAQFFPKQSERGRTALYHATKIRGQDGIVKPAEVWPLLSQSQVLNECPLGRGMLCPVAASIFIAHP